MIESRRRFGSLAVELTVVVLGVLIALGADSWWQRHEDTARELSYLRAIRADMMETLSSIDDVNERLRGWILAADSIGTAIVAAEPADDAPFDWPGLFGDTPVLSTGTLDALVQSGELRLLRSESLRTVLVRAVAELEDEQTWFDEVMSQAGENLALMVRARLRVEIEAGAPGRPRFGELRWGEVRRTPELAAGFPLYANHLANILGASVSARDAATTILDAVNEELGARGIPLPAPAPADTLPNP